MNRSPEIASVSHAPFPRPAEKCSQKIRSDTMSAAHIFAFAQPRQVPPIAYGGSCQTDSQASSCAGSASDPLGCVSFSVGATTSTARRYGNAAAAQPEPPPCVQPSQPLCMRGAGAMRNQQRSGPVSAASSQKPATSASGSCPSHAAPHGEQEFCASAWGCSRLARQRGRRRRWEVKQGLFWAIGQIAQSCLAMTAGLEGGLE